MSIEKSITLIVVAFIATLLAWVIFSREDRSTRRPGASTVTAEREAKRPKQRRAGLDELRQRQGGGARRVDFAAGRDGGWKPAGGVEKHPKKKSAPESAGKPRAEREKPVSMAPRTVEVRRGDSFYTIAERELGDGRRYVDIVRANPGVDPRRLRPGQTIVLPGGSAQGTGSKPAKGGDSVASTRTYEVRRGDTLSDIAKKFYGSATKWPRLLEANRDRLASPERLRPGMVVRVP